MATNQQPGGENLRKKKQSNQQPYSESREKTDSDLQDDGDGMDSERRTGTSTAGNTANDSFNDTAEKQQTDRDKNAEG